MSDFDQGRLDFSASVAARADGEVLVVDLDAWEGPLDVLLALARAQKVDLLKLSIARLADQYLEFVRDARRRRFALAGEYLVMAAWLAYLKSRLLLPKPDPVKAEEPPAEEVAAALAFRLAKLDAMRKAGATLSQRPLLNRDLFTRGDPEAAKIVSRSRLEGDLHALINAYLEPRVRTATRTYRPPSIPVLSLEGARMFVRRSLPALSDWTSLHALAPRPEAVDSDADHRPSPASCLASTLSACLEMTREGELDIQQAAPFSDIRVRSREARP